MTYNTGQKLSEPDSTLAQPRFTPASKFSICVKYFRSGHSGNTKNLQSFLIKVIIIRIILIYIGWIFIAMPTQRETETPDTVFASVPSSSSDANSLIRIKSQDLFQLKREIEIEHAGRIYRLQLTQSNKLILTA